MKRYNFCFFAGITLIVLTLSLSVGIVVWKPYLLHDTPRATLLTAVCTVGLWGGFLLMKVAALSRGIDKENNHIEKYN